MVLLPEEEILDCMWWRKSLHQRVHLVFKTQLMDHGVLLGWAEKQENYSQKFWG